MAINLKNADAVCGLAHHYKLENDHINMVNCYLENIHLKNNNIIKNLNKYYTKNNDKLSMHQLALNYKNKDDNVMVMILSELVKKNDSSAMCELGLYYQSKKDHENMIKYFVMASKLNNNEGLQNLIKCYGNNNVGICA